MSTIAEVLAEKCVQHKASQDSIPVAWERLKRALYHLESTEPGAIYIGRYGDSELLTVTSSFSKARQTIGIDMGWGEVAITCYGRSRSRLDKVVPIQEQYKVSAQLGEVGFSNRGPEAQGPAFYTPEELAETAIRLYLRVAQ